MNHTATVGGWRAARIAGAAYPSLDRWIRTGLLTVEGPASGKGSRRRFTFLDLLRAKTVVYLRRQGVSLQTIRKVQAALTEQWGQPDPLAQAARLVVADDRLFWVWDDQTLLDALTGQLAAKPLLVLPVGRMAQEIRAALEKLAA